MTKETKRFIHDLYPFITILFRGIRNGLANGRDSRRARSDGAAGRGGGRDAEWIYKSISRGFQIAPHSPDVNPARHNDSIGMQTMTRPVPGPSQVGLHFASARASRTYRESSLYPATRTAFPSDYARVRRRAAAVNS